MFADGPGRRLLVSEGGPQLCVIVEGVPDWLTWATHGMEAKAVFGVAAGSWCVELALRVPDGSEVVIRTHRDEAGDKYAAGIIDSFHGRDGVRLLRGGWPMDENDSLRDGMLPEDAREGAELVGISAPETDDLRRGEPT